MAAAAAFLLVSAGAATGYFQWGINTAPHIVDNNPASHTITATHEPGNNVGETPSPLDDPGAKDPGALSGENEPANTETQKPTDNPQQNPVKGDTTGNRDNPAGSSDNGTNGDGNIINAGELELMNTNIDRVVERTFVQMKVEDFKVVHSRALDYINGANAGYEVIASENTETGSQESLKIVVDNSRAEMLLENLSALGPVVVRDNTKNNITAEYNENVEQVSLLRDQFEATGDVHERQQLQVKITGIMAQLKTWDQEAKKKTIILLLEN